MAEYTKNELFRFDMMNAVEHESPVSNDDITEFVLDQIRKREIEIADRIQNECSRNAHLDQEDCVFCQIAGELRNPADDDIFIPSPTPHPRTGRRIEG